MSFENKVIVITGGSGGIGSALCLHFVKKGANVVIVDKNKSKLPEIAEKCSGVGKEPLAILANISNDEELKLIIEKTIKTFGKIDILINCAGILGKEAKITDANLISTYDEIISTNLRAAVLLTQLALPYLIESKGNIINISSRAGIRGSPGFSSYAISKAGLIHFGTIAALELAELGVRVNSISPGPVNTQITANLDFFIGWKTRNPQQRKSEPREIAELVAFLASDKAISITGSNYVIDCGSLTMT